MHRRNWAGAFVASVLALLLLPTGALSQTYPDRSVRIIIAFAAGGTIDTLGRIVAQKLSDAWGQSVFVENRGGASGNIGAQVLAGNVTLAPIKGFDPMKDFEPSSGSPLRATC